FFCSTPPFCLLADWLGFLLLKLFFLLSALTETSAIQLNGVLGESVTFHINESKPFATISWSKTEKKGRFRIFALVAPGNPCKILIPIQAFKQRVSSSKDCRNLQLSHLSQEDINRYTANIVLTTSESINEHFDLKVYSECCRHTRPGRATKRVRGLEAKQMKKGGRNCACLVQ
uniref:Uncharacterized protein n=1 Tax=Naja naja TaxID=35670 RepID=A0A8C6YIY5_NAJNA